MVVLEGVDLDALNYIIKYPYNGTGPTGGDSLTEDLNIWYEVSDGFILRRNTTRRSICSNKMV